MNKLRNLLISVLLLMVPMTSALADVNWINDPLTFTQFNFDVEQNRGNFGYIPSPYISVNQSDEPSFTYNLSQGETDPYDSIANGNFTEGFGSAPGSFELDALAMATGQTESPADGLEVRAYARSIPSGLDSDYGVAVNQRVITFVTRYFEVTEAGNYALDGQLGGDVRFDAFSANDFFQASSTITAEITIQEYEDIGGILIPSLEVFSASLAVDETLAEQVSLTTTNLDGNPVVYLLKVRLILEADIINFNWIQFVTMGDITGTYDLGRPDDPITLTASVTAPHQGATRAMPWIPLLLLDD